MNNNLLKDIRVNSIKRKGKSIIITTNDSKYVLKEVNSNYYDYLIMRGFNYMPPIIKKNNTSLLMKYIDDKKIPPNQRLEDMTYLISLLHSSTCYHKKIDLDSIKEIYEDINNRLDNLMKYYLMYQDLIEEEIYMSPANYLLIRNISLIYASINKSKEYLEKWYKIISDIKTVRYVYSHGNLKIDHLLESDNLYLISWDNSKINLNVYDIDNLYRNNFSNIKIDIILGIYSKKFNLNEEEIYLLFSLILIPSKIDMNKKEFLRIIDINSLLGYLSNTLDSLKGYSINHNKETNKQN